MDDSKHIDFMGATLLGVALSLNNIGGGLSAGIIGLNSLLVGSLFAALNFIVLWAKNHLATFFIKRNVTDKAAVVGGFVMIAIGIELVFR
jgi:putative Mn2+ efflux pump MntP